MACLDTHKYSIVVLVLKAEHNEIFTGAEVFQRVFLGLTSPALFVSNLGSNIQVLGVLRVLMSINLSVRNGLLDAGPAWVPILSE